MKIFRAALLAISFTAFSFSMYAQKATLPIEQNLPRVVYKKRTSFPQIFRSGVPGSMAEECNPGTTCTGNGLFVFEKAKVGEIKECVLFIYVANDTIKSCRITTQGKARNKELYSQVVKQFGEPLSKKIISEAEERTLYLWPNEKAGSATITTSLTLTKHKGEFRHWYQPKQIAGTE